MRLLENNTRYVTFLGARPTSSLGVALPVILALASVASAATPPELEPFSFLLGEWRSSGSGSPGLGEGTATFSRELQGQAIVRTSFAEYPAQDGKPASRHDDLMVIYSRAGRVRADYYDSEGHVIRYSVRSPAPNQAVFVSDPVSGAPRFRLSYRLEKDVLKGTFEISPSGTSEPFEPYLKWESTKVEITKDPSKH